MAIEKEINDFIDGKEFRRNFVDYFHSGPGNPDKRLVEATLEGEAYLHGDPTIETAHDKIMLMVQKTLEKEVYATTALQHYGLFPSKTEKAEQELQNKEKPTVFKKKSR